jgi:predicted nuclease of predicted toxin-antitoxin system
MRILADVHISPRTCDHLRALGHDVVRATDRAHATAPDAELVLLAASEGRVVLTQDLDFAAIVATSGLDAPSVITLRLASSRVDHVNGVLRRVLPAVESEVRRGALVTIDERRVRVRALSAKTPSR